MVKLTNDGQGTIEYLVILGVIILIGLVVVGLSTNFLEQTEQINTTGNRLDSSVGITGISITENVLDASGNGAITLTNTDTQPITLTKIVVDGIDNNYNKFLFSGDSATLLLNNLSCTCSAGETSKTCTYTFYFTQNGVITIKTKTLTANCSGNFGGGGGAVPPTVTDTTGPTITLSSPADGYQQTSTGTTTFSFSVSDASTVSSCSLTSNSVDVNSIATPSADVTLNYEFTEDLNYDWTVTCIDSEANSTTTSSREISIDNNNYEINNCQQLYNMRNGLSSTYKLMENVNCSGFDPEGMASSFTPIGAWDGPFTGTFDGNGNSINNFSIPIAAASTGLFGEIEGGSVYDLAIINANIVGSDDTGILTGKADTGTTINRVFVNGKTSGSYETGGLVGYANGATITNVYADVNVSGYTNTGGIIGYLSNSSTLDKAYSKNIIADQPSGGWYLGGIVGFAGTNSTITNCYSIANITQLGGAQSNYPGGILGYLSVSSLSSSYWDTTLTGQNDCYTIDPINGGSGDCDSTTDQESSYYGASGIPFANLGFSTDVWQSRDNNHPIFVWQ